MSVTTTTSAKQKPKVALTQLATKKKVLTTTKTKSNAEKIQATSEIQPAKTQEKPVQKKPAQPSSHINKNVNQSTSQNEWVGEPRPIEKDLSQKIDEKLKEAKTPGRRVVPAPPLPDSSSMHPLQDLLQDIDTSLLEAKNSFNAANTENIAIAAGSIAHSAESFGLRTLGRLARTVEAAAKADDMDALKDLFPELEISVERNRIALKV